MGLLQGRGSPTKWIWANLFPLIILGILSACAVNPAGPPAPLVEMPGEVSFPDGSIDVSTIGSSTGSAITLELSAKALVGPSGEFSRVIIQGPSIIDSLNEALGGGLAIVNAADIPVSTTLTQLEFADEERLGKDLIVRYDFSPFDYDGDGVVEACTGCTCPTGCAPDLTACPAQAPLSDIRKVCFRIWQQKSPELPFERLMAGYFDFLPLPDKPETPEDESNAGKGNYTLGGSGKSTYGDKPATSTQFFTVLYDHRDPSDEFHLATATHLVTKTIDSMGAVLSRAGTNATVDQVAVDSSGIPNRVKKTVKTTFESFQEPKNALETFFSSSSHYIGRFREDLDFWSGSFDFNETGETPIDIPTTCARISTADGVPEEICVDAGIDTSGESVLPPAPDLAFPADFPELPTF